MILAESQLNGDLYPGGSISSNQPRFGNTTCTQCQPGTWPDPDGQRLIRNCILNY